MKYFTLSEFTRSAKARSLGISNAPTPEHEANIKALVETVLDPLRQAWGHPINVTSGYRSAAVNAAVGGARKSHHLRGMAADISVGSAAEHKKIFALAIDLGLPFTQLLWERGTDLGPQWIHISYDPADIRREVKRTDNLASYYRVDREGRPL